MVEFTAFPKISRWSREVVITEKLDGTNAAIIIDDNNKIVGCQSRNKLITPDDDNYGFAKWVDRNKEYLGKTLGEGVHYGEWWGNGIQRGYGLKEKRFSLFNVSRWRTLANDTEAQGKGLWVVPQLWNGPMEKAQELLQWWMDNLKNHGSVAVPNFTNPEGVVLFHTAGGYLFKKTFEKDTEGKGTHYASK